MKTKEIFDLTSAEIEQKINAYKEELFNLRFQAVTGHLENTARIGQVRKNIARCKTILYGRELDTNRSKKRRKRG